MNKRNFIKKNWGFLSINEIANELNINVHQVLEIAYELNLYSIDTPDISRRWTMEEEEFIQRYAKYLTIRKLSNLLYRSYYATYLKIRLLGLEKIMIRSKEY